jgi:hypothetical protein
MSIPDPDLAFATILQRLSKFFDDATLDTPRAGEPADMRILDIEDGPMLIVSLQRAVPPRLAMSIPIGSIPPERQDPLLLDAMSANFSPEVLAGGVLSIMTNSSLTAELGDEHAIPALDRPVLVLRREESLAHLADDEQALPEMASSLITVAASWTSRVAGEPGALPADPAGDVIYG